MSGRLTERDKRIIRAMVPTRLHYENLHYVGGYRDAAFLVAYEVAGWRAARRWDAVAERYARLLAAKEARR